MDVSISGNVLTVKLDNTSPISTSTSNDNIPALVAFGWDLGNDPLPTMVSWSLKAFDENFDEIYIDDQDGSTGEWEIDPDGKLEGTSLDFIPNNDGASSNVAAALYNPAAELILDSDGQTPHYFTQAVLTMEFDDTPLFSYEQNVSPYVRMQRVGNGTAGSLKLYGVLDEGGGGGGGDPVPEPATFILFGIGLLGLAKISRRKK
ncbi:hypothetical protein DO021_05765 [Desulfobacter hydrogenophilus]|uniref:PEP-CTERM sorting domain-containing protein n=2 Tax=Desulfobacter hydrogenophilus TaxID=2291 RepID=A0A328FF56_9BACT|nr:PEP-CTERM sorting domain-containing protein [Desulfobacter hydrogenophilus]QBH15483.1 PEP-CTERM sorting domain-containing protein [Desulfobacter hydrogenophilus]RAM02969.1 hypothetical protein DO021_05765 [Desulfobacter hydrogenophilus]